jgi:hypothetical protein
LGLPYRRKSAICRKISNRTKRKLILKPFFNRSAWLLFSRKMATPLKTAIFHPSPSLYTHVPQLPPLNGKFFANFLIPDAGVPGSGELKNQAVMTEKL